ncbi:5'/3'-nucleotidase SurE [Acinetobacter sp. NCu2D-2]|uniref:5'/3'-nucleotidase SurE n=1 Tax=Acinetobacter sp. NCu2D-2 TaxID=1608473 RepID=UPI0007CDCAE8|nr:5'/3'-nucleotidase SurE [Acinetobacter sp. NCu2D-2]ANF81503.1 5'/3'-nucleotidase SurE [Acinetobacter sp. NCu2D-2]
MNILISNDDGVLAPGIQALAQALKKLGRVVIVAPDHERSGFSSALTIDRPLRPVEISTDVWAVDGTPADCVYLATNGLFDFEFDLVVSGINNGPNLGDHILYSGTVGAAMGGRLGRLPSIAVSLCGAKVRQYTSPDDFKAAAEWVAQFIASGLPKLPPRYVLNMNIPDIEEIKGIQVTHQSHCHTPKPIIPQVNPRGYQTYWISLAKELQAHDMHVNHSMADFEAVAAGFVSLTPIQMETTNAQVIQDLQSQLSQRHQVVL